MIGHAANLARFALVASIVVFAFAFNLAAMYAQVVYVFLPATRVTGAPPMHWVPSENTASPMMTPAYAVLLGLAGLYVLWCTLHRDDPR